MDHWKKTGSKEKREKAFLSAACSVIIPIVAGWYLHIAFYMGAISKKGKGVKNRRKWRERKYTGKYFFVKVDS